MARLIDHIRAGEVGGATRAALEAGHLLKQRLTRDLTVVTVDHVAEFWAENRGATSMCPPSIQALWSVLPPYDEFWIEYRVTRRFLDAIDAGGRGLAKEVGAYVTAGRCDDAGAWYDREARSCVERDLHPRRPYGWMQMVILVRGSGEPFTRMYACNTTFFDELGAPSGVCLIDRWGQPNVDPELRDWLIYPMLLGLAFMSLKKEVQLEERTPPRNSREQRRRKKPLVSYKVLRIDALAAQIMSMASGEDDDRLTRALHTVRRHIRVYGPDRPHVSGYVGSMLIRPHLRGSKYEGVVVKDYSINAGPAMASAGK